MNHFCLRYRVAKRPLTHNRATAAGAQSQILKRHLCFSGGCEILAFLKTQAVIDSIFDMKRVTAIVSQYFVDERSARQRIHPEWRRRVHNGRVLVLIPDPGVL